MREAYTVMREAGARRRPKAPRGAWRPIAAAVLAVGLGVAGLGAMEASVSVAHATLSFPGGEPGTGEPGTGEPGRQGEGAAAATAATAGTVAREAGSGPVIAGAPAIVRFHVVPHSDATVDQQLKLRVRDRLLGEMEAIASRYGTWSAVPWGRYVQRLAAAAEEELAAAGVPYGARATWGLEPLSPGHRAELDLPGEQHPTLRVILGDGRGSNWWCVLFPPLCFMDASHIAFAVGDAAGDPDAPHRLPGPQGDGDRGVEEEAAVWRFGLRLWPFPGGGEEGDSLWSWDALRQRE